MHILRAHTHYTHTHTQSEAISETKKKKHSFATCYRTYVPTYYILYIIYNMLNGEYLNVYIRYMYLIYSLYIRVRA